MGTVIDILRKDHNDVQKEAAYAISNFINGGGEQELLQLVEMDCVPAMCALASGSQDAKCSQVITEGLRWLVTAQDRYDGFPDIRMMIKQEGGLELYDEVCGGRNVGW